MDKEKKVFFKNSFLLTVAPFLPKIINVILLPIMTLYLTDVDFGISGTISSYTSAIGAFTTLGLTVVLQNSFFKTPLEYKGIWRQLYGFLKIWMIFYALIQAVLLYFCIPEEAIENRWWIILLTNFSTVFFGPTGTIGNFYYIYTKQSWPIVWRSVMASLITIAVDFILIVHIRLGYMGWYVGSFAGLFFSNASYYFVVNRQLGLSPVFHFDWGMIKHSLKVGIPTIPHYYTAFLLEGSGRMILDQNHVPQSEIGRVSISQTMGEMMNMGINGLNNALSPYIMQYLKNGNEKGIRLIGVLYCTLIFLFAFFVSLWSKEIFALLLSNESLASSYPFFILFAMALCYRPMYMIVSYYYFYYEQTKQLLMVSFVAGLLAIFLYVLLTPRIGVMAFLIGHYVSCLYYGYSGYCYKCYKENAKIKMPWIYMLLLQLTLTFFALILVEKLFVKILVSIVILFVGVFIFVRNKSLVKL